MQLLARSSRPAFASNPASKRLLLHLPHLARRWGRGFGATRHVDQRRVAAGPNSSVVGGVGGCLGFRSKDAS
jgi:hypothetical protein